MGRTTTNDMPQIEIAKFIRAVFNVVLTLFQTGAGTTRTQTSSELISIAQVKSLQ